VVKEMALAWVLTLPATALIAAALLLLWKGLT
jgi:phosphate/sulfate permease